MSCSWFQTSQTGGQWYSDTSPFSIPWFSRSVLDSEKVFMTWAPGPLVADGVRVCSGCHVENGLLAFLHLNGNCCLRRLTIENRFIWKKLGRFIPEKIVICTTKRSSILKDRKIHLYLTPGAKNLSRNCCSLGQPRLYQTSLRLPRPTKNILGVPPLACKSLLGLPRPYTVFQSLSSTGLAKFPKFT